MREIEENQVRNNIRQENEKHGGQTVKERLARNIKNKHVRKWKTSRQRISRTQL